MIAILFVPTVRLYLLCYVDDESLAHLPSVAIPEVHVISLSSYATYLGNGERLVFDRNTPQRGGGEVLITVTCEPEHKYWSTLLALSELKVSSINGEEIGPIEQNMKLKGGEPVILQAIFANPSEKDAHNIILLQVRNAVGEDVVYVKNEVTVASETEATIDSLWHPNVAGTYTMFIYVLGPKDIQSTDFNEPVRIVQLEVV